MRIRSEGLESRGSLFRAPRGEGDPVFFARFNRERNGPVLPLGKRDRLVARADRGDRLAGRDSQAVRSRDERMQFCRGELALAPGEVHFHSPSGPQAIDMAVAPGSRPGGTKTRLPGIALREHLSHPRRSSKVSIDLTGRLIVGQIWPGRLTRQHRYAVMG